MWIITINGKEFDALLLAEDAMTDWAVWSVSDSRGSKRLGLHRTGLGGAETAPLCGLADNCGAAYFSAREFCEV